MQKIAIATAQSSTTSLMLALSTYKTQKSLVTLLSDSGWHKCSFLPSLKSNCENEADREGGWQPF